MESWNIAWRLEGEYGIKNIKNAIMVAPTLHEAKMKWLAIKPEAILIIPLCRKVK